MYVLFNSYTVFKDVSKDRIIQAHPSVYVIPMNNNHLAMSNCFSGFESLELEISRWLQEEGILAVTDIRTPNSIACCHCLRS
jgi:hypothetical protein